MPPKRQRSNMPSSLSDESLKILAGFVKLPFGGVDGAKKPAAKPMVAIAAEAVITHMAERAARVVQQLMEQQRPERVNSTEVARIIHEQAGLIVLPAVKSGFTATNGTDSDDVTGSLNAAHLDWAVKCFEAQIKAEAGLERETMRSVLATVATLAKVCSWLFFLTMARASTSLNFDSYKLSLARQSPSLFFNWHDLRNSEEWKRAEAAVQENKAEANNRRAAAAETKSPAAAKTPVRRKKTPESQSRSRGKGSASSRGSQKRKSRTERAPSADSHELQEPVDDAPAPSEDEQEPEVVVKSASKKARAVPADTADMSETDQPAVKTPKTPKTPAHVSSARTPREEPPRSMSPPSAPVKRLEASPEPEPEQAGDEGDGQWGAAPLVDF